MLRHEHISVHAEAIAHTACFKHIFERDAGDIGVQIWETAIATERDEVIVLKVVVRFRPSGMVEE